MEAVLGALAGLVSTLAGVLVQQRFYRGQARADDQAGHRYETRAALVDLVHALSVHRGHLYDRWDLAHAPAATDTAIAEARRTSHLSRATVTRAVYELRSLTQDATLLQAVNAAVSLTYAVKSKGEALESISKPDLAARRKRAIDADDVLLARGFQHLTP